MKRSVIHRLFVGITLIGIGILFIAKQMGYVDFSWGQLIGQYWPLILIYFGLQGLLSRGKLNGSWGTSSIGDLILLLLGVMFLGQNFGVFTFSFKDFFKFILPIIIIGIGLKMIFSRPSNKKKEDSWWNVDEDDYQAKDWYDSYDDNLKRETYQEPPHPDELNKQFGPQEQQQTTAEEDHKAESKWNDERKYQRQHFKRAKQNESSFIGDFHLGKEVWELSPLNVSHFIGDTVLDLTKAIIPEGETKINVSAFIGDIRILFPNDPDLEVRVSGSSFLGDMDVLDRHQGGLMRSISETPADYKFADKRIRINTSTFIGDITIKRVG